MPTLPWTTPAGAGPHRGAPGTLAMASRFELERWRDVPGFFISALRIRDQMLQSPGVIGVSLVARPLRRTFFTLSAWRDRAALNAAVAGQPHAATMARYRTRMADSAFTFWEPADDSPPDWRDAVARLDEAAEIRAAADGGRTL
ncbi:DUF3291 domain-containing protein [Mycolicibacterium hippocampi]|uniref:DUF3291 domain-containing protein n=1 Tax=Mycolicibacterium hippocampi TaxID=659824 RepID=A0A7I9ZWY8_9MYCO|nr:DUF3291 domain-containing protein [Mycolicibacterium hippocampi]GFH05256.1 hypothetical protein MHIP_57390 [Mycolicibacterium hippocampi]